jgi:hypothetical protein
MELDPSLAQKIRCTALEENDNVSGNENASPYVISPALPPPLPPPNKQAHAAYYYPWLS